MPLEIACFNLDSMVSASKAGADRIELCADRSVGGVTPMLCDLVLFKDTVQHEKLIPDIPVFIMVRPRGGNFTYSQTEFREMKQAVSEFSSNRADGFVFGILDSHGKIDLKMNKELVEVAAGKPCTFHRAFDGLGDFDLALEEVIRCGFRAILTAGGRDRQGAMKGSETIKRLVEKARGRIEIIPGGGVRSDNLVGLKACSGAVWFHSSAIVGDVGETGDTPSLQEIQALKRAISA